MTYYLKVDKNYEEYNKLKRANSYISFLKKKGIECNTKNMNDQNKDLFHKCIEEEKKEF